jgi:hypothetical protein
MNDCFDEACDVVRLRFDGDGETVFAKCFTGDWADAGELAVR